ncbi:bis(5'-nucleosyl)-tetraphosphatase (symmetrical) YqeK [Salsuginibacillus kocurii]|uniref:bis(5'-nucleosyl)-tetraphosphatase (symmetrical) YqeK n=1 Tax=Salsuginibacillus kocurii TaxID=427078 RepID=UPI00036F0DF3|nr:bis(5'-nucleosyl)-tetraphosphatase (symmetrical) YqeK [Salsuginibacillus kocurii]
MNKDEALAQVKEKLTAHRYTHTLGVKETAISLAKQIGVDSEKAEWAAILHDYAKFRPKEEMKTIILGEGLDPDFISYGEELLHAPAGACLVRDELGISDADILRAIMWHTTGKKGMDGLEKVVFLADYIEPNRNFPGVNAVREEAEKDIDRAVILALSNTISFLLKKSQPVFPKTLEAYNDLIMTKHK